jgi:cytochrome b6-f complex iron-sulfur subunit
MAVAALPVLAKLGGEAAARAAGTDGPAAPAEKWVPVLKAADLADGKFAPVDGQKIVLSRSGKTVVALSTVCTHKGCEVLPQKTRDGVLKCKCHNAEYDSSGNVTKRPANQPLPRYAVRLKEGMLEVNTATKLAAGDKAGAVSVE